MTLELGQTYTGGPELSVRCFGPGGPPLDLRSADGTLWVQFADLDVAVDLELRATDRDPLELLDGSGGHEAAAALHERAGGDAWRPIPPFDVVASALSISPIPGANAIVAHETVGSPVGTFAYYDTSLAGSWWAATEPHYSRLSTSSRSPMSHGYRCDRPALTVKIHNLTRTARRQRAVTRSRSRMERSLDRPEADQVALRAHSRHSPSIR